MSIRKLTPGAMRLAWQRRLAARRERRRRQRTLGAAQSGSEQQIHKPAFIVGSPRSGTTFLGQVLERHPDVLYLNEPKWFWSAICPQSDSYGVAGNAEKAQIELSREEATERMKRQAHAGVAYLMAEQKRTRLVEKTPDNAARIAWLDAIFPDARFIHLLRDPHDAALSLDRALAKWFPRGWKGTPQFNVWQRHCLRRADLAGVWQEAATNYQRGLIIWRELNRLAAGQAESLPALRYQVVRYESLMAEPATQLRNLLEFLQLDDCESMVSNCVATAHGHSIGQPDRDDSQIEHFVGGELLARFGYAPSPV